MPANLLRITLSLLALLIALPANATVYCVNSASAISDAFFQASTAPSGSIQDIRIRTGTYSLGASLSFGLGNDDKTFELTGGWNSNCSSRVINPANTVLSGTAPAGMDYFIQGNQRSFRIEGIRFENFGSFVLVENVCGGLGCPDTNSVRVRYNHFRNGRHVRIHAHDAQTYVVSNNLFEGMSGPGSGGLEDATVDLKYAVEDSIPQVVFNTFSLACFTTTKPALQLQSQRVNALFSHNILVASGCTSVLHVDSSDSGKAWRFKHNLYPVANTGLVPAAGSAGNLIGANPQFVSATDFHLRETAPVSPAINAGQTPLQGTQDQLAVPAQDLDGPAGGRLVGSKYDMGAFESSVNDASVLLVTNDNDSGTGSLRTAITSANASPGLQKIHFNIPGGCSTPNVIALQSELPDITDSVEIDGYSEPDAAPNTLNTGSDAVICIVLFGLNASLAHALQVPQAAPSGTTLTVKGLAFSSFENAVAIRLRGGSNHRIQGNAIGGIGPGALGDLFSNAIGVQVRNDAQNALIGGPEPEDRNSIGAATTSAVSLLDGTSNGHTVQNNYIGLAASGISSSPIGNGATGNGIFASSSANVKILDNVIAAVPNGAAISITGATATGYEIARNKLGTSASGVPTAAFRNATGIVVTNGSGGHQIGGILNQAVSNTITNSSGAGVHLTNTAGIGTTVRPNRIFGNGVDVLALGIDLGDLGPLPNDPGDVDGGPNNGQNKPVISNSLPNPDGTRQVSGSLSTQNGSYIIDIYRSPDCPNSRGNMLNLVGTDVVDTILGGASFDISVPGGTPGVLTAVATRVSNGDTSEVSDCFLEAHQTSTTITVDNPDPSQFGQNITVGVIVTSPTGGTPTGTVAVSSPGGAQNCTATLSGGVGSCQLLSTMVGALEITANYQGNFSFLASSDTEPHVFSAADTVTTITADAPDPSQVGEPYSVQVEVRRQHDNVLATTSGTVTISDGTGQTCQATLTMGVASCPLTSVTVGNKTLSASFAGNLFHNASADTEPHVVVAATTTTTITSDAPDPSAVGQAYTVAVTVAANPGAGMPAGAVAISDGSGASCNIAALSNGMGSCQLTSTSAGAKTLTATYTSASQAFANSSDTEPHQVGPLATTTTITGDAPDPSLVGQPYTVSVAVASGGGTPSGSVAVGDGSGASCNIAALSNGMGSCQLTSTSAGAKTLTANYTPDSGSFSASSDTEPHQVNAAGPAATMTEITVHTPNPSRAGEPFTVGITVTSNAGTPTGNFTIDAGLGGPSCQGTLSNGSGSCQLTYPNVANGLMTACKVADANFGGSCDGEVHMSIKADTSLDLGAFAPNPVNVGSALTANATLSVVAPGAGNPTGSILVSASPTEQCTIVLPATQCQLLLTTAGNRNIEVSYPGDANFNATTRSTMVTAVVPPDEMFANGFE